MKQITLTDLREMMRDIDISDEEIAKYLLVDQNETRYAPSIQVNTEIVDDEGLESDLVLAAFNDWSRRRRQRRYQRKIEAGWDGLRIVSEGDSWFQYPFLLKDVIDHLSDDYAIFSLGAAGDLVSDMLDQDEISTAVRDQNPDVLLISGGGNDLLGDGRLATALHPFKNGRPAKDYLNDTFKARLADVINVYRTIFTGLLSEFPALKIVTHGYDYALPDTGRWLGKPMEELGIKDTKLQADIVKVMIDRFNASLVDLANEFPGSVHRVNTLGAVGQGQWKDELHPNNEGYAAVANKFRAMIESIFGPREMLRRSKIRLSPGKEAMISDARDLEPDAFRRLVDHRGREILSADLPPTDNEDRRREIESDISQHYEKISGGADFLPASFLERGAKASAAVCRIKLPRGSGSGFLVGTSNFIMTNNHVLASKEDARSATAEFFFEDGKNQVAVALNPDKFFITLKELDFTIVACDGAGLTDVTPIALLRSPSTVTRGEKVNIIQHPRGRAKEVALHNNGVKRLKDKVVWYETDTEPGSSGSPVFNNEWDLVALHHAGWFEADGSTTNEGIRIAAIVSHLVASQRGQDTASQDLFELLGTIPDSSPHLGFFDIVGIADAGIEEVEIPEYRGSEEFADIGFWNIEHFNDGVSDERVRCIAEVIGHLSLDAIGLLEVQREAMERLIKELRQLGHAYDFKYLNVRGRQDLAVLYDLNTTQVTLAQKILNRHRDAWAAETPSGRTAFPRRPLVAHVKVEPKTGRKDRRTEFIMIAVHLKAFGDPESRNRRRLAANILAEVIKDIRETEGLPVILGGDLNEELTSDVLSGLTDAPDLFTLTADDAQENALSYVGADHRSLIDHIVVSNDVSLSPISGDDAAIVRLDKSISDFVDDISDHVPLVVRVISRRKPLQVN